jgi:hypothetical protein
MDVLSPVIPTAASAVESSGALPGQQHQRLAGRSGARARSPAAFGLSPVEGLAFLDRAVLPRQPVVPVPGIGEFGASVVAPLVRGGLRAGGEL